MNAALIVIAKAPRPGRSKTRLCPPLSPLDAARIAEACLIDTLGAVREVDTRRVVVLDGDPGAWLPPGFEVIAQRGDGLATRIATAFHDVGGPAVLIGMDTPQVTPDLLRSAIASLEEADGIFAPAEDGGWWAIGLRAPEPEVFRDIPMSTPWTGPAQHARLHELDLTHRVLPTLRDVDDITDARAVAAGIPASRLAYVLDQIEVTGSRPSQDVSWLAGRR
jgi:rSAM/selenodomain-associated transferase 1